jgi:hypothetical protein
MTPEGWQAGYSSSGERDLNLLLFAIWDPIGVSDSAIAAGEYESYVDDVFSYVRAAAPSGASDHQWRLRRRLDLGR